MTLSDSAFHAARSLIADRLGLDFPERRRADLERGLVRGCKAAGCPGPEPYLSRLGSLPQESTEWMRLAGYLTVGETYFFRDEACFDALQDTVLPGLIERRRAEGTRRLRLWSAGCATGEEPYSLAILLDRLLPDRADWSVSILATDINVDALEAARRGRYRAWALRGLASDILERYFRPKGGEYFELGPRIREMVTFTPLNLAQEGYPSAVTSTGAVDLILCRNALMYFSQEAQRATAMRLTRALVPGGWLIVSPAEASSDLFGPLVPVNFPGAVFYRKEDGAALSPAQTALSHQPSAISFGETAVSRQPSAARLVSETASETLVAILPQPPTPVPQPPLLERARALADLGRLGEARQMCEDAVVRDPLEVEAYLLLASICQEQADIPAALEALRRAIYLDPDSASAHFMMGSLLSQQGQPSRARRYLATAVRLLGSLSHDQAVPGGGGLTAGRLLETARMCLDLVSYEARGEAADSLLSTPRRRVSRR